MTLNYDGWLSAHCGHNEKLSSDLNQCAGVVQSCVAFHQLMPGRQTPTHSLCNPLVPPHLPSKEKRRKKKQHNFWIHHPLAITALRRHKLLPTFSFSIPKLDPILYFTSGLDSQLALPLALFETKHPCIVSSFPLSSSTKQIFSARCKTTSSWWLPLIPSRHLCF